MTADSVSVCMLVELNADTNRISGHFGWYATTSGVCFDAKAEREERTATAVNLKRLTVRSNFSTAVPLRPLLVGGCERQDYNNLAFDR